MRRSKPKIKPICRIHKIEARLSVMGVSKSYIAELWGITPQRMNSYINSAQKKKLYPSVEKFFCKLLGVSKNFFIYNNWDELLTPHPEWLVEAMEHNEKKPYEDRPYHLRELIF